MFKSKHFMNREFPEMGCKLCAPITSYKVWATKFSDQVQQKSVGACLCGYLT